MQHGGAPELLAFKCNSCWVAVGEDAFVCACHHLFCERLVFMARKSAVRLLTQIRRLRRHRVRAQALSLRRKLEMPHLHSCAAAVRTFFFCFPAVQRGNECA